MGFEQGAREVRGSPTRRLTLHSPPLTLHSPALRVGAGKSGVGGGECEVRSMQISVLICRQDDVDIQTFQTPDGAELVVSAKRIGRA